MATPRTDSLLPQSPESLAKVLTGYELHKKSADADVVDALAALKQPDEGILEAVYHNSDPSSHFLRWRPHFHLQASTGWMNDPCAPSFDPNTGLYHLFFQWNAKRNRKGSVAWGTCYWGHAVSKDMVHWTVSASLALKPDSPYDEQGVFTGCMLPPMLELGDGKLVIFYTGVSRLPLHYTLPYLPHTESLNVAQSEDSGKTWSKITDNPILSGGPEHLDITGWRDPVVSRWHSMDRVLGRQEGQGLYGVISGGIRSKTPTTFLYEVNPADTQDWKYLNTLNDVGLNHSPSRWAGDLGVNWECANFITLHSDVDDSSRDFLVMGCEGANIRHPNFPYNEGGTVKADFPRPARTIQWLCGELKADRGGNDSLIPTMDYKFGGPFDNACLYAVNTFYDPNSKYQIAWGWIIEDDLPQQLVDKQGWSGMISLPRELSLTVMKGVVSTCQSRLEDISSIEIESDSEGTFTLRTMGIAPAGALAELRKGATELAIASEEVLTEIGEHFLDVRTHRFELDASFTVSELCTRIGLSIFHDEVHEPTFATSIIFVPDMETLMIQRPNSAQVDPEILTFTEKAAFTLFRTRHGGVEQKESLNIRAFFDESVLEVFANSRCAFAVRVYPPTKRCWGIRFWAEDVSGQSKILYAKAWDGIKAEMKVE